MNLYSLVNRIHKNYYKESTIQKLVKLSQKVEDNFVEVLFTNPVGSIYPFVFKSKQFITCLAFRQHFASLIRLYSLAFEHAGSFSFGKVSLLKVVAKLQAFLKVLFCPIISSG